MTLEELRKLREGWSPDNFKPLEEVLDLAEAMLMLEEMQRTHPDPAQGLPNAGLYPQLRWEGDRWWVTAWREPHPNPDSYLVIRESSHVSPSEAIRAAYERWKEEK